MKLYVDVETLPSEDRARDAWIQDVKVGNRGEEKAAEYRAEKADEAWRKTSLCTMYARVLCIGVALGDREPVCIIEPTEEATLRSFAARLMKAEQYSRDQREALVIVTHNGHGFDLPLLCRRMAKYADTDPTSDLNGASSILWIAKSWGDYHHVDTMVAWEGASRFQGSGRKGLTDICAHLGISRDDDPTDGSRVLEHFEAAEHHLIQQHVVADVHALRQVYARMSALGMVS